MSHRRILPIFGVLIALLTACGWQLRGAQPLPTSLARTYIDTEDRYTDFYRELRRALLAAGVQLTEQSTQAGARLTIRTDDYGQRLVAVSARNTPQEYQVYYAVDYSLAIEGTEVLPAERLELNANYSYDSRLVLAKQHEQRIMQQVLARELAAQVMRRLTSLPLGASQQ